jgi:hypothetical protein
MEIADAIRKLQPVRDEFLVRFYRWSTEFSRQEFDRDFPIVGRIKNPSVQAFVFFARSLVTDKRFLLGSGFLKKFHPRATEILKEFPSVEETVLMDKCLEARRALRAQSGAIARPPSKAHLQKILTRRLGTILGEREEIQDSRDEWAYSSRIRCWTVKTRIDIGGRRSFGYSHSVNAQYAVDLQSHVSILSWMGIGSQTDWFDLSESDYDEAADTLLQVCACFLNAVPDLLNGLSHDLPEPEVRAWRELVTVKGQRQNGMTIVSLDTPELRKTLGRNVTWEIPTSIIPERLRTVGSHLAVVQDPAFLRKSTDPMALSPTYRHVRVELLNEGSRSSKK